METRTYELFEVHFGHGTHVTGFHTRQRAEDFEAGHPEDGYVVVNRFDVDIPDELLHIAQPGVERELVTFTCRCGNTVDNFLFPGDERVCLDCKAVDDRARNGWTPENSID